MLCVTVFLKPLNIGNRHIKLVRELYRDNWTFIEMFQRGPVFSNKKGGYQGDNLTPLLFPQAIKDQ